MDSRRATSLVRKISSSATAQTIPVLGTIVAIAHDSLSISDRILQKKCDEFFQELNNLSEEDQRQILKQFDSIYVSEDDKQEFGERLISYINNIDDSYKTRLTAKTFRYWMAESKSENNHNREITEDDFYHVVSMIINIPSDVLKALEDRYARKNYHIANNNYSLIQYGIYTLKVDTKTINETLVSRGSQSDDFIKITYHGEILKNAIWNGITFDNYKEEE